MYCLLLVIIGLLNNKKVTTKLSFNSYTNDTFRHCLFTKSLHIDLFFSQHIISIYFRAGETVVHSIPLLEMVLMSYLYGMDNFRNWEEDILPSSDGLICEL